MPCVVQFNTTSAALFATLISALCDYSYCSPYRTSFPGRCDPPWTPLILMVMNQDSIREYISWSCSSRKYCDYRREIGRFGDLHELRSDKHQIDTGRARQAGLTFLNKSLLAQKAAISFAKMDQFEEPAHVHIRIQKEVYCLSRIICTSPGTVPVLDSERHRYTTHNR